MLMIRLWRLVALILLAGSMSLGLSGCIIVVHASGDADDIGEMMDDDDDDD